MLKLINQFPKSTIEPSWDRKLVSCAIRHARYILRRWNEAGLLNDPSRNPETLLEASHVLRKWSQRGSNNSMTFTWSDQEDLSILAFQLRSLVAQEYKI